MINSIPVHAIASLNKAAELDVMRCDMSTISEEATDHTHNYIGAVAHVAEMRFYGALARALNLVADDLKDLALQYVECRADDILLDRYVRAQRRM